MKRLTALSIVFVVVITGSCTQPSSPSFPSIDWPELPELTGYLNAHYASNADNRKVDTEISLPKDSLPIREGFFYYGFDIHSGPILFEGIEFTGFSDSLRAGSDIFGTLEGTGLVGRMTTTTRDYNDIRGTTHELDGEFEGHRWDRKETVSISFSIGELSRH